jgi:hypothetical protein
MVGEVFARGMKHRPRLSTRQRWHTIWPARDRSTLVRYDEFMV